MRYKTLFRVKPYVASNLLARILFFIFSVLIMVGICAGLFNLGFHYENISEPLCALFIVPGTLLSGASFFSLLFLADKLFMSD